MLLLEITMENMATKKVDVDADVTFDEKNTHEVSKGS